MRNKTIIRLETVINVDEKADYLRFSTPLPGSLVFTNSVKEKSVCSDIQEWKAYPDSAMFREEIEDFWDKKVKYLVA